LTFLSQHDPDTPIIPRDIYNHNAAICRELQAGQSPTEALLSHLIASGIKHHVLLGPGNRVKGLFIACPSSIKHLQTNQDVILVDNTYSTNRFDMPLMNTIG